MQETIDAAIFITEWVITYALLVVMVNITLNYLEMTLLMTISMFAESIYKVSPKFWDNVHLTVPYIPDVKYIKDYVDYDTI